MGALAQHHVQQDQAHLGIGGLLTQPAQAQVVVEHRVQPALGKLVLAQVQDGVRLAVQAVGQGLLRVQRHVGIERRERGLEAEESLYGQGAAGEEAAEEAGR